jgi:DNA-binding GntR family transcriptional regulator
MPLDPPGLASRASLREQIGDYLRAALVSGAMVPGVTYSVPTLAERFGVSATPVREAMLDLAKEGMVTAVPNKGFRVVEVSDTELDDVTEVRRLLEVPTVGRLTGALSPEDVARLRSLAEEIETAAAEGDLIHYIETDRRFHLELLALGGNRRLVDIVDQLRARTRLYGLGRLAEEGQLARSAAEHIALVAALTGNSHDAVERIMTQHIRHVRGIWASRDEVQMDDGRGNGAGPSRTAGKLRR